MTWNVGYSTIYIVIQEPKSSLFSGFDEPLYHRPITIFIYYFPVYFACSCGLQVTHVNSLFFNHLYLLILLAWY